MGILLYNNNNNYIKNFNIYNNINLNVILFFHLNFEQLLEY